MTNGYCNNLVIKNLNLKSNLFLAKILSKKKIMIKEYRDAVVSINERTGKKTIYNKANGRIDNRQYAQNNSDNFLTPDNPRFVKVYGEKAKKNCDKFYKDIELSKDRKRQAQEEIDSISKNYKNKIIV